MKRVTRRQACIGGAASLTSLALYPPMTNATSSPGWAPRADLPYKVQEIYPTSLNGQIHIAGGFIARLGVITGATDKHAVYDPRTDQWHKKAPMPEARHHPNLVSAGEHLFALGGFKMSGPGAIWQMQSQTWRYSPDTDSWSGLTPATERHGETVCLSLGSTIHVIGGRRPAGESNRSYSDHQDTKRHLLYDVGSDSWLTAAPALKARNSAAGAVIDSKILVVGGRQVNGANVADLEIYDPQEDRWRRGAPMPQAQGGLAAASLGGKLYAFGGEYFSDGGGVYAESWVYDPQTDKWDAFTSMLTPRHGLGAVALNNWIYTIGGAKKASGNDTAATLERIRP